jgi:hypothetical protein
VATKKEFTQADVEAAVQAAIDAKRWQLPNLEIYGVWLVRLWYVFITLAVLYLAFRQAPVSIPTLGRTAVLSKWTAETVTKLIPVQYQSEVKTIFRESYQETAQKMQSGQIASTADARLQVSQLIQAKVRALNRSDEKQLIQAVIPLSNALGERFGSSVKNDMESVQKAFSEIAKGL